MNLTSQFIQNQKGNIACGDLNVTEHPYVKLQKRIRLEQKRLVNIPLRKISFNVDGVKFDMICCPKNLKELRPKQTSETDDGSSDVSFENHFWLGETEVTQEQFKKVMGFNPSQFKADGKRKPVEKITWYDAILFCNKLSVSKNLRPYYRLEQFRKKGNHCMFVRAYPIQGADGFRLPTDKEWKYAAQAGTNNQWAGCDDPMNLTEYAWFGERSTRGSTHPVKEKKPNEWGFYDMSGNVGEWVWCSLECQKSGHYQALANGGYFWSDVGGVKIQRRELPNMSDKNLFYVGFRIAKNISNKTFDY